MLKRALAVVTLVSTVFVTMPVSAAELGTPRTSLGSVSSVGSVSLRGVDVPQEGTIFSGDELQVGSHGYAKIVFVAGHRLELDRDTKVNIQQPGNNIVVQIRSGNVGFTSAPSSQLTLMVGPYEIIPDANASGNVALIGKDALGLRTMKGKVAVHQLTSSHIKYVVSQGQERILTYTGQTAEPVAQIASALPAPIPAVPPAPDPQTAPAGKGLSKTGWIAVLATIGGAAAAIAVLATSSNSENTTSIVARQQAVQGTQTAIQTAQQASATAIQLQSASTQATAALASLPPSTAAPITSQFQQVSSQANAANQQITTLLSTLNGQLVQLQSATSNAQIQSILSQINSTIAQLNTQIQAVNAALLTAQNAANSGRQAGANIPTINITTTPTVPPVTASASTP
jgi:hypothetical protein